MSPGWRGQWATEPKLGRVANGVPNRVDRIKCLGNAVVPQVAEVFAEAIKEKFVMLLKMRIECKECNHVVVCRDDLKNNLEGLCPFYEPTIRVSNRRRTK